jgi:quercetin dioxygenase-like cupin family protein
MRTSILIIGLLGLAGCQYQETPDAAPGNDMATADAAATSPPAASPPITAPPAETALTRAASDPLLKWGPCPAPLPTGCELTVLHGDPARPNADVMLRMPGGYVIPPHRHSSAERMVLVSGQMEVKYQGSAAATLNAGNYAYGPPNVPHRATCVGTAQCHLFVAFEGPVDVVAVEGSID